jgi:integrase
MRPLTDKALEAAKPKEHRFSIYDHRHDGLQLVVYPSGVKSWCWRGKVRGQTQKHTLGRYPAHGLADAREWAAELIRLRDGGLDPRAERHARQAEAERVVMTVDRAFGIYMEREGSARRTGGNKQREYDRDIKPRIGARALVDVDRKDLAAIISDKFGTAPVASNRLQSMLCRFFRWCVTKGYGETGLESNPAQYLVKLAEEQSRERVLCDYEIGLFLKALPVLENRFATAFKLLLLTGTRRSEVVESAWPEFDLAKGEWLIPAERCKNGRPHLLPLGPMALALVNAMARSNRSNFLFPSRSLNSDKALSGFSKAHRRLSERMNELAAEDGRTVPHWRLHDLRRTVATGLSGLMDGKHQPRVQPHVVEALLNHVSGARAGVAGTYNRHAYYAEKKTALIWWERHLKAVSEK